MKQTIKKRKSKTPMEIADGVFSEYIRKRDRVCLYGMMTNKPCSGVLQCAHIISKGACSELRYDSNNAIAMCSTHHIYGWHSTNGIIYTDWFTNAFPKRWAYLQQRYASYLRRQGKPNAFKPTKKYYEEVTERYKKLIRDIQEDY